MPATLDYRGRRAVVTGCASGIGAATARLLLDLGAEVHGVDLRPGASALAGFHEADLRDAASIEAAAARIGPGVDALFNCAGLPPGRDPRDVMTVNFIGTRHLTDLVAAGMPAGGAIANIASNGGAAWSARLPALLELVATPSFDDAVAWFEADGSARDAAYSVSKEAVIVWTMASAAARIGAGIRVNCTSPGAVSTPMLDEIEETTPSALIDVMAQPIGRRSGPEEQAWPLVFLNSPQATYVNGANLQVDGGFLGARITGDARASGPVGRR